MILVDTSIRINYLQVNDQCLMNRLERFEVICWKLTHV